MPEIHVTVLMSTYNGDRFIEQQVESVLNQTGVNVSLIIRDDGSDDGTRDYLEEISRIDNVLVHYGSDRLGPAKSFITLLNMVDNLTYVAFCDQDDLWDDNKLIRAVTHLMDSQSPEPMNASMPMLYCSALKLSDQQMQPLGTWSNPPANKFAEPVYQNCVAGNTAVMNAAAASLIQGIEISDNMIMHDWWLYLITTMAGGKIIYDYHPAIHYRQHLQNVRGVASIGKLIVEHIREVAGGAGIKSVVSQFNGALECLGETVTDDYRKYGAQLNNSMASRIGRIKFVLSGKIKARTFSRQLLLNISFLIHGNSQEIYQYRIAT